MFYSERHDKIIKMLKEKNHMSVHLLAAELYVSEPTVRRDLAYLEEAGLIRRTFGGAMISDNRTSEVPLVLREQENRQIKEQLAIKAIESISDGNVIFLDASSTVSQIVKHLSKFHDLTIITNSPKTSVKLAEHKIKSYCTGGLLLEHSVAYVGGVTRDFVENFNADIVFFSCRGVSEDGMINDSSFEEIDIKRAMLKQAKKKIFLCSSDKFNKKYAYNLCSCNDVDLIISDKEF